MQIINSRADITIVSPIMTKQLFEKESGLRAGQIRGQMARHNIPEYSLGTLKLVNVAKFVWGDSIPTIGCPAQTAEAFAQACGLTTEAVKQHLFGKKSRLPRYKIGRLVLVDVAELTRRCLDLD